MKIPTWPQLSKRAKCLGLWLAHGRYQAHICIGDRVGPIAIDICIPVGGGSAEVRDQLVRGLCADALRRWTALSEQQ